MKESQAEDRAQAPCSPSKVLSAYMFYWVRKARFREVRKLVQGHTAARLESTSGLSGPLHPFLSIEPKTKADYHMPPDPPTHMLTHHQQ